MALLRPERFGRHTRLCQFGNIRLVFQRDKQLGTFKVTCQIAISELVL